MRYILSLVVVAACSSAPEPAPKKPEIPTSEKPTLTFSAYPNARELTWGHVNGGPGGMHISWSTSATTDEPERVVAHYEKVLGRAATKNPTSWSFNESNRVLEIIPAANAASFPGSDTPPNPSEKTVLLSSTAAKP